MHALIEHINLHIHMWFVFAVVFGAILSYVSEKIPMEVTSISVITLLVLYFYFYPLVDLKGSSLLTPEKFFYGFANPALITVMSMLVIGYGVVVSGSVKILANYLAEIFKFKPKLGMASVLMLVCVISAFMNNTPVVVIFIPVLASMAKKMGISTSSVMMPLAFAATLGGMTTLIGTSTNLLISGKVEDMGLQPLTFFEFILPGVILCCLGMLYVTFIMPRILPDRFSLAQDYIRNEEKLFVGEIKIGEKSALKGRLVSDGRLPIGKDVKIKMVQRGENAFIAPFEKDFVLEKGDIVVFTASRNALAELVKKNRNAIFADSEAYRSSAGKVKKANDLMFSQILIAPGSYMSGRTIEELSLTRLHDIVVLGVQRGSKNIRKISSSPLQSGDVLLVLSPKSSLNLLAKEREIILLSADEEEVTDRNTMTRVNIIFFSVIIFAATNIVPIEIASFAGASLIVLTRCLTLRQTAAALNKQVFFIIATAYMLSISLEKTGGAEAIAGLISSVEGLNALSAVALLFLAITIFNEVMSNNAAGLLFTPIAINLASQMGADPRMFIWAVIFAGSCSFATPIGYQTNLLVMAPGRYKFSDYLKAGIPLNIIIWSGYLLFAWIYFF